MRHFHLLVEQRTKRGGKTKCSDSDQGVAWTAEHL